jgi:hypothetical protein
MGHIWPLVEYDPFSTGLYCVRLMPLANLLPKNKKIGKMALNDSLAQILP